jgi:hypothetical protein
VFLMAVGSRSDDRCDESGHKWPDHTHYFPSPARRSRDCHVAHDKRKKRRSQAKVTWAGMASGVQGGGGGCGWGWVALLTCVVNSAVANCSPSRSVESVMKNGGSVVAGSCFFPAFPLKPRDPDSVQHARTAPAPRGLCRANQPPRPNVTALHVALLKAMADVATRTVLLTTPTLDRSRLCLTPHAKQLPSLCHGIQPDLPRTGANALHFTQRRSSCPLVDLQKL